MWDTEVHMQATMVSRSPVERFTAGLHINVSHVRFSIWKIQLMAQYRMWNIQRARLLCQGFSCSVYIFRQIPRIVLRHHTWHLWEKFKCNKLGHFDGVSGLWLISCLLLNIRSPFSRPLSGALFPDKINCQPRDIAPSMLTTHFAPDNMSFILQTMYFLELNFHISNSISMTFVPDGLIDTKSAIVQIMAWRQSGDRPLPEPILTPFNESYKWERH